MTNPKGHFKPQTMAEHYNIMMMKQPCPDLAGSRALCADTQRTQLDQQESTKGTLKLPLFQ